MKKELYKSLQSYGEKLNRCTLKLSPGFKKAGIHTLRTTFKRIRALLRWQGISGKPWAGFKKSYGIAGDLSNIEVVRELLKKENDMSPGFKKLAKHFFLES